MIKKIFTYNLLLLIIFFCANAQDKFLSLKNSKVNVRYGPSLNSPIKYIYIKKDLPVQIIDQKENFRRIIDLKKNSGWIHRTQLKTSISFIIMENKILFKKPSLFSRPIAKLEKGRLLLVKKCKKEWCSIKTENYTGWVKNNNIWGYIN